MKILFVEDENVKQSNILNYLKENSDRIKRWSDKWFGGRKMQKLLIEFSAVCALSFLLTAVLLHFIIPILRGKKVKQHILEIGPRWHASKEGTPTMGGIIFLIVTLIGYLIFWKENNILATVAMLGFLFFGIFWTDNIVFLPPIFKKRNQTEKS